MRFTIRVNPKAIKIPGVPKKCMGIALVFIVAMSAVGSSPRWRWFKSSAHFSIMYPENWVRINAEYPDRLELASSKGGLEAVVIKDGQANIFVSEAQHPTKTLSGLINLYTKDATVISRRSGMAHRDKQRCSGLERVVLKEEAVPAEGMPTPAPYFIYTEFFCELGNRKIVLILKNWEGDKKQKEYQEVASKMAESIRLNEVVLQESK
jgi:hypothetical protein